VNTNTPNVLQVEKAVEELNGNFNQREHVLMMMLVILMI
jgi:hypothetical protein